MAIDLQAETVVSLADAARRLPAARSGKKRHASTLWRWHKYGIRGVTLETIRTGGNLSTSLEALQRFCDRLSEKDSQPVQAGLVSRQARVRTAAQRQRDHEAAERALDTRNV